jgi:hypothetical protein
MNATQQATEPSSSDFQTAVTRAVNEAVSEMYMVRRKHIIDELAYLEDRLIQYGRLERRTKPPSHRKDE